MAQCFQCGKTIPTGMERTVGEGSGAFTFCAQCAPRNAVAATPQGPVVPTAAPQAPTASPSGAGGVATVNRPIQQQIADRFDHTRPNYPGAIGVGLIGAVLASLLWYGVVVLTHIQIGYLAILVGWVIGFGVVLGSGGKRGGMLVLISLVLTLGTMVYSEYLIFRFYLIQEAHENLPYIIDPIRTLVIVGLCIKEDPLTLLFWGIALFGAFRVPSGAAEDE